MQFNAYAWRLNTFCFYLNCYVFLFATVHVSMKQEIHQAKPQTLSSLSSHTPDFITLMKTVTINENEKSAGLLCL